MQYINGNYAEELYEFTTKKTGLEPVFRFISKSVGKLIKSKNRSDTSSSEMLKFSELLYVLPKSFISFGFYADDVAVVETDGALAVGGDVCVVGNDYYGSAFHFSILAGAFLNIINPTFQPPAL